MVHFWNYLFLFYMRRFPLSMLTAGIPGYRICFSTQCDTDHYLRMAQKPLVRQSNNCVAFEDCTIENIKGQAQKNGSFRAWSCMLQYLLNRLTCWQASKRSTPFRVQSTKLNVNLAGLLAGLSACMLTSLQYIEIPLPLQTLEMLHTICMPLEFHLL